MKQGRVYFPGAILPPEQATHHRVVILSNSAIINRSRSGSFLTCAIIRSAKNQTGRAVQAVPGHSIPVKSTDFISLRKEGQVLKHDSIIETHQIFHISWDSLNDPMNRALGDLDPLKLQEVLTGARRLLT